MQKTCLGRSKSQLFKHNGLCESLWLDHIAEWMRAQYVVHGPLARCVKSWVAPAPGMPGTLFNVSGKRLVIKNTDRLLWLCTISFFIMYNSRYRKIIHIRNLNERCWILSLPSHSETDQCSLHIVAFYQSNLNFKWLFSVSLWNGIIGHAPRLTCSERNLGVLRCGTSLRNSNSKSAKSQWYGHALRKSWTRLGGVFRDCLFYQYLSESWCQPWNFQNVMESTIWNIGKWYTWTTDVINII